MADKHLPYIHVQIFTVGGYNAEVALCYDSLDIGHKLEQDRHSVVGPYTVLALFYVGDPASTLKGLHNDLRILPGKRICRNGQKLDQHKAHRENDEKCEQHQA